MIAILHNIRSMHNVGSIFRTADAVGIEKIYICGITPTPLDRFGKIRQPISKVSLGAENYISWEYFYSASRLINRLKKEGYQIFSIEQSSQSVPYHKLKTDNIKSKTALVVGNEISGLSQSILKKSDKILEIPMLGKKESLNVSVAFGIVAFKILIDKESKKDILKKARR